MYDCGITAKRMIDGLQTEVDVAAPITDEQYIDWLNELEQMLYGEIIKEQRLYTSTISNDLNRNETDIILPVIHQTASEENNIISEDIISIFYNTVQLIKTTPLSKEIFTYCWSDSTVTPDAISIKASDDIVKDDVIRIYFVASPLLKTISNYSTEQVKIPIEFLELVKSWLRYNAYMFESEFTEAANQVGVYNQNLEMFKAWVAAHAPQFGM